MIDVYKEKFAGNRSLLRTDLTGCHACCTSCFKEGEEYEIG